MLPRTALSLLVAIFPHFAMMQAITDTEHPTTPSRLLDSGNSNQSTQYDTLPPGAALGEPQVGTYNGLEYVGWAVDTTSPITNSKAGLIPQSGKNTAIASSALNLPSSKSQVGIINAEYGTNSCFDLGSFYYGCVKAADEGLLDEAEECTVTVTGYRGTNMASLAGKQVLTFEAPADPTKAPMKFVDLSKNAGFKCLSSATFVLTSSPSPGRVMIDNFVHTNYAFL